MMQLLPWIGFEGCEYATCVSVNDEICHGFPRKNLILKEGDLVKVDTVVDYHGAFSDSCWSYVVGKANPEVERLMEGTKKKRCILGSTKQKSVIGSATSGLRSKKYVEEENGYGDVREFIGPWIGPTMYESPT